MKENFHREEFTLRKRPSKVKSTAGYISISIPAALGLKLRQLSQDLNISRAELVTIALDKFFERVKILKDEAEYVNGSGKP